MAHAIYMLGGESAGSLSQVTVDLVALNSVEERDVDFPDVQETRYDFWVGLANKPDQPTGFAHEPLQLSRVANHLSGLAIYGLRADKADGRRYLFDHADHLVLGREYQPELDRRFSRQHAELAVTALSQIMVRDMGSTNGTFVMLQTTDLDPGTVELR